MIARLKVAVGVTLMLAITGTTIGFVLLPFRWPAPRASIFSGALEILGNPNDFSAAFQGGADAWKQTGFDLNVVPDPVGACDGSGRLLNGADFFAFDCGGFRLGRSVLAVTETVIALADTEGKDGEIRAVGITFNSDVEWDVYPGPWRNDVADFGRVALHEQGHVIGLDHEDSPGTQTIMRSFVGDIGSVQQDDIDGVRERYPELTQSPPPQSPPGEDAPESPVDLPPLNPPADTPTDNPPELPPTACFQEHLKLAGAFCKSVLGCFASNALNPGARDACIANAEPPFLRSDCATQAWAEYIGVSLGDVDAAIREGIDASEKKQVKLQAKLLKLAGKHCGKALAAERKNVKKPNAGKLASKRSKARSRSITKSNKAIAKLERKGFSYEGPRGNAIADNVDSLVNDAAGK